MGIHKNFVLVILSILLIAGAGAWFFVYDELLDKRAEAKETSRELQASLIAGAELLVENKSLLEQFELLEERLEDEQDKFDDLEDQVSDSLEVVALIRKASQIDEELLQKYSQVFFLNEHYIPKELASIDKSFKYYPNRDMKILEPVSPFLDELLEDAKDDEIELLILSAYRSFDTQAQLKGQYVQTFGTTVANRFSADQGYSEHQLGSTVDFTTNEVGSNLSTFESSEAFEWLEKHAYKYGFVLSYPENNGYYIYEPWHWRFVGKDLAKELQKKNLGFYDLDQRTIDEYRVDLFEK